MQRVLVTGATGFIGRHLPPLLLERGLEVHAVSSRARASGDGITWHAADLLVPDAVDRLLADVKPSHLVHLAWYAGPTERWTTAENVRWLEASLALLRAFTRHGGRRAVLAGTAAEYEWQYGFCVENTTPLRPSNLYGQTKLALGAVAQSLAGEQGIELAWARVFFVYGPGEDYAVPIRLIPGVARALVRGEEIATTEGGQFRDFLHAADVADAFAAILASSATGPINVGSGQPVAVRDLVSELAAQAGRPELVRAGAMVSRSNDVPLVVADVRRLREEVRWRPRRSLSEGLAETLAWWREHEAA